jgi:hypothetical protein
VDLMNEVDFNGEFLYFWREWKIDFSSQATLLKNVLVYNYRYEEKLEDVKW